MWTRITPNTDTFYAVLGSVIKKVKSTDNLVITGNFNVKTGTAALESNIYKKMTGIYGKGKANSNGYILLEPAKSQSLKITNTFFKHKNRHRSTWKSHSKSVKLKTYLEYSRIESVDIIIFASKITQMIPSTTQDHTAKCVQNQITNSS